MNEMNRARERADRDSDLVQHARGREQQSYRRTPAEIGQCRCLRACVSAAAPDYRDARNPLQIATRADEREAFHLARDLRDATELPIADLDQQGPVLIEQRIDECLQEIRAQRGEAAWHKGRFADATQLLRRLVLHTDFPEFLTLEAYDKIA